MRVLTYTSVDIINTKLRLTVRYLLIYSDIINTVAVNKEHNYIKISIILFKITLTLLIYKYACTIGANWINS